MVSAGLKEFNINLVLYVGLLIGAVLIASFLVGLIKSMSCTKGATNAYEHFQDTNTINKHINDSLISMNTLITTTQQKLQDSIDKTISMKAQACSAFDGLRDKYVQSYAKEANDPNEYSLPEDERKRLIANRRKNGEDKWDADVNFFKAIKKKSMLNCGIANVSGASTEGFQDANLESLAQILQQSVFILKTMLEKQNVANWLAECDALDGTASFVKRYVNNTQVKAEIGQCISDLQKSTKDFNKKSDEEQSKLSNSFDLQCNAKYGSKMEPFQDYKNSQFSFPVPFPSTSLNQDQLRYYTLLSDAQNTINKINSMVGTKYQNATASFILMGETQKQYQVYKDQLDSVQTNLTATTTPVASKTP
jgi:hypothetical protein